MDECTSIKQLIQSLMPAGPTVVEGTVTATSPLAITLTNDSKMVLTQNSLVVPRYLTDHQVEVDLRKASGTLASKTKNEEGKHKHEGGEHDGHETGDGKHTHEDDGDHIHHLDTFDLEHGILSMYNGLKKGETVYLLQFDNGKRYFVIDRKG